MKELFYKFVKRSHHIVVDDANFATTAAAVYDTLGKNNKSIMMDRVLRINSREWLISFDATDAQYDEITKRMSRS